MQFQSQKNQKPYAYYEEPAKKSTGVITSIRSIFTSYPLLITFIVAIVVANIWNFRQNINTIEETASVSINVPTIEETTAEISTTIANTTVAENAAYAVNSATADAAATETGQTETTTVESTTEPPAEVQFQTVDQSYFDDALFIGDSCSEGLALYGSFTNADYFTSVGLSIFKINEVEAGNPNKGENITFSQKLSQQQYGKVYIMLGLNELAVGSTESWAETYESVIEQIREAQPNATIYIQSILPVSASEDDPNGEINNQSISTRNEALEQLKKPEDHIYYLNVGESVMDENSYLESSYTSDGIHLLGNSLSIWEDYLKSHAAVQQDPNNESKANQSQDNPPQDSLSASN
ncbi:MAG: GDSL-type esterase/lipase family protein [Ruminococcus sp.]|nr:GDSL-type esterase/lipase family protein [Ruminococcus sp.]